MKPTGKGRERTLTFPSRHLVADIQPLICIQEGCDRELDTFTTNHAWLEHMASHNQGWYCHASTHSGKVFSFSTRSDFENHMQFEHLQSTTAIGDASYYKLISTISENSHRPSPIMPSTCPICASDTSYDERVRESVLNHLSHMYSHLLDLAMYSLPEPESGIDASLSSNVFSLRLSSPSLSSMSGDDLDWFEVDELGTENPSRDPQNMSEATMQPLGAEHLDEGKGQHAPDKYQMRFKDALESSSEKVLDDSGHPYASNQSAIDWWLETLPAIESLTKKSTGNDGVGEKGNHHQMEKTP